MTGFVQSVVETKKAQAEAQGRTLQLGRPRIQLVPRGIERRYRSQILDIIRATNEMVVEQLLPNLPELVASAELRDDAAHADIEDVSAFVDSLIGSIRVRIDNTRLRVAEGLAAQFAEETSAFSRRQLVDQMKGILGVDAFPSEQQATRMLTSFTRENGTHIRSLPNRYLDDVSTLVQNRLSAGDRPDVIAAAIRKRFGAGEKQAALIARDQVNKLNGALTRMRQTNLGIEQYIWRTSRDERVREQHLQREGRTFSWNSPPEGGHPGQAINCRCTAEPVIEGIPAPRENRREVIRDVKRKRERLRKELKGKKSARLIAR